MKINDKVNTKFGYGTIISKENNHRFCVKLEICPDKHILIQNKFGGLFFWKYEIEISKQGDLF